MPRKPPLRPPPDPLAPAGAVAWFRDRLIITDDELQVLEDLTHDDAFTIAGVAELDLVTYVWEQVDRAIANGESLGIFQERVADRLAEAWGGEEPWRVETIFRTQVQRAYSASRYLEMTQPAVAEVRPYLRFSAVLDARTTPACEESDDTVLPQDDPWWRTHIPPLHFNCRSHIVTLSESEATEEGIDQAGPTADAADGFGSAPEPSDLDPDLGDYPPDIAAAYQEKGTGT